MNWLRKTWSLLAIIVAGLIIFGDFAQLAVTVYRLSAVALVLVLCDCILDHRKDWGLFPSLDLDKAIDNALTGTEEVTFNPGSGSRTVKKNPIASALVFLGFVALLIAILFIAVPSHASTLDNARPYLSQLAQAETRNWPAMPLRHIAAGQIEQESSWKPQATLRTSRELGRGLVQMTIAYDKTGAERFNIYRDAVRYRQLQGWDWRNDPYNVRNQLTFLVLQDRANYSQVRPYFRDDTEAWKGALVCYNAGTGRWLARRAEAKRRGIPADVWTEGLDRAYAQKESAILYGRPLYLAVNEYPRVIFTRAEKYRGLV